MLYSYFVKTICSSKMFKKFLRYFFNLLYQFEYILNFEFYLFILPLVKFYKMVLKKYDFSYNFTKLTFKITPSNFLLD